jgi:glutamate 5-kinase
MTNRSPIQSANNWVVKIGSALMTRDGQGLARDSIQDWVGQLAEMKNGGKSIVLVSSGAVAEGMVRLKLSERPDTLHGLQAAAAVGQMGLIEAWESAFAKHGIHTAQILLTHDDLANRRRYLNARNTLKTLLEMGVVPIVNENDTVATDEIRFGDNDSLGALVANLVEADVLTILTDQQGLFDADPRNTPGAKLIQEGDASDERFAGMAGEGGALGRGGMITKVSAAKKAARSGAHTLIASGWEDRVLARLAEGEQLGTLLVASQEPMAARKQWLASRLHVAGTLVLDGGAVEILKKSGKSLLPIGVTEVQGDFQRGDLVSCVNGAGLEVARGLVNFNSADANKIKKQSSDSLSALLGYSADQEIIHRDNLVLQ